MITKQMIKQARSKFNKINLASKLSLMTDAAASEAFRPSDDFLSSPEWKSLRSRVLETYGICCMKCGCTPKKKKDVNVDHIKPRKYYPELSLCFDNLQVLCGKCNKAKGNKNQIDYRPKK